MKLGGNYMIVGVKDSVKLISISVIACCAVLVCTLFLNYNLDLAGIKHQITTEVGFTMYNAQVSLGKVTSSVSGGCLAVTSVIMLLFYVKHYIDAHGKELGILKAMGYSNMKIAKHFWVFGISVLIGCSIGFGLSFIIMPLFYSKQNYDRLLPEISIQFHPILALFLIIIPTLFFIAVAVFYANYKIKNPVLDLLREKKEYQSKVKINQSKDIPFLQDLRKCTLKSRKTLTFFIAFSAFCFSAMTQMSFSMTELASEMFTVMVITIGLVLAFTTLFISVTTVIQGNAKTIAMMRVFGYSQNSCSKAILGGYRPISYLGFAIGTIYQYGLLKVVVSVIFKDVANVPEYNFDNAAFVISLVVFIAAYEFIMYFYSLRIKKLSIKSIMLE